MRIQTKFFGEIELHPEQCWHFPKGFRALRTKKNLPYCQLKKIQYFKCCNPSNVRDIAFIVANPYVLVEDYTFDVDEPTIELLEYRTRERYLYIRRLVVKRSIRNINYQLTSTDYLPNNKKNSEANDYQ